MTDPHMSDFMIDLVHSFTFIMSTIFNFFRPEPCSESDKPNHHLACAVFVMRQGLYIYQLERYVLHHYYNFTFYTVTDGVSFFSRFYKRSFEFMR